MSPSSRTKVVAAVVTAGCVAGGAYYLHKKREARRLTRHVRADTSLARAPLARLVHSLHVHACRLAAQQGLEADAEGRLLLPSVVVPRHYDLFLEPDLEKFTFSGTVKVLVDVRADTRSVVCHAHELVVSAVTAALPSGAVVPAQSIVHDGHDSAQTVAVMFGATLKAGTAVTLEYTFTGVLNDKMAGFYRSSYVTPTGETRYMATTQFESTDARRAFPCWDEPALKATFAVTLRIPQSRTALSNMPEKSSVATSGVPGCKDVTFDTTPRLSTYLVAFVVGEFSRLDGKTKEGVAVRVFTPPGMGEQGTFALGVATKALSFFTRYFGEAYPLPKLDLVAVPDFSAGAMENWGLVTFRSQLVLYDPSTSGSEAMQRIAYVTCHELAHQWFGNLVTMTWWSDLWLNEGFATFAGWMAVHDQFPKWRVWDQFLSNEQARGLELDALESSHPIQVPIPDSSKVSEIFDAISYAKGASVIHQLVQAVLDEPTFQAGMRLYIQKHKWGNAATSDLWAALSEASGTDVHRAMACWTQVTGLPVLTVSLKQPGLLEVTQQRFLSTGAQGGASPTWIVPLRISTSVNKAPKAGDPAWDAVLTDARGIMTLPASAKWAKLNTGQAGFYRVAYSPELLEPLAAAVPSLPPSDRAGLVADAFALAAAGHASTRGALMLVSALAHSGERDYTVWAAIASGLGAVSSSFYEAPGGVPEALKHFTRGLYAPLAVATGWSAPVDEDGAPVEEGHLDTLLRTMAISRAAYHGDAATLEEAKARFARFTTGDHAALAPDLRAAVFRAVLTHGGRPELEALVKVYTTADPGAAGQEVRVAVLQALGYSQDAQLVRRALDFALRGGMVRSQDIMYVVASAAGNPAGRRVAWQYCQSEIDLYAQKLGTSGYLLGRVVALSTSSLASESDARDVDAFFKGQSNLAAIGRSVAQSVEKIHAAAAWVKRDAADVAKWLAEQGYEA